MHTWYFHSFRICTFMRFDPSSASTSSHRGFDYIYRPQRSWAKVIFSQACVKNSVHRGGRVSASVHAGTHHPPPSRPPPPDQADPPPEQTPPLGADSPPRTRQTPPRSRPHWDQADTPPPGSRLQHTVYERPVRILLECILVEQYP